MKKILILSGIFMLIATSASADEMKAKYLGLPIKAIPYPAVSAISTSSAVLSLAHPEWFPTSVSTSTNVASVLQFGYFEYGETHKVCIAIYPTPASCLPSTTAKGLGATTITNLKPDTEYFVRFVKDSSIQCITTPCPTNAWKSGQSTFKTLSLTGTSTYSGSDDHSSKKFKRDLWYRTRGDEVKTLQQILINLGFLRGEATGFFGNDTFKAVKNYQRQVMHISPTGKVGPMTRAALHVED